jgi:hypothetical protein
MSVLQIGEYFWFQTAKLQVITLINKLVVNIFTLLFN